MPMLLTLSLQLATIHNHGADRGGGGVVHPLLSVGVRAAAAQQCCRRAAVDARLGLINAFVCHTAFANDCMFPHRAFAASPRWRPPST
jgi:hypothetical protein